MSLMGEAALRGQVTMILKRRVRLAPLLNQQANFSGLQNLRGQSGYPYDVIVSRHEHEGFGFVIISSSNQYYGSTIGGLYKLFSSNIWFQDLYTDDIYEGKRQFVSPIRWITFIRLKLSSILPLQYNSYISEEYVEAKIQA